MGLYLFGLAGGLFLVAQLLATWRPGFPRTALILVLGTVVGFVFGLLLIMGIGALQLLG